MHDSLFVPLAKWPMLIAGNYRCVRRHDMIAIRDAVHGELERSRRIGDAERGMAGMGYKAFIETYGTLLAGIALFVAAFLIYNTFSMLVAQRGRELALLRAVGALRRQVLLSVLVEAVLVAFVAAFVGIGLGYLLAVGLKALLGAVGLVLRGNAPSVRLGRLPSPAAEAAIKAE